MGKLSVFSVAKAILFLPFTVTVIIPSAILYFSKNTEIGWGLGLSAGIGALLLLGGLFLMFKTIKLFAQIGKGTLAPWDPPKKLVVAGPYQYVRNPMISGVLFILLGEAAILAPSIYSSGLLCSGYSTISISRSSKSRNCCDDSVRNMKYIANMFQGGSRDLPLGQMIMKIVGLDKNKPRLFL